MGFVKDAVGGILGSGSKAAGSAAREQQAFQQQAIKEQRAAREQLRKDLQPFVQAGESTLPGLQGLTTSPEQQLAFAKDNPFFDELTGAATGRLSDIPLAAGRIGSTGVTEELSNRLLEIAPDLINQNIQQRFNLAAAGQQAAAGQASGSQLAAQNIGASLTEAGQAGAQGILGRRAAEAQAGQQLAEIAGQAIGSLFGPLGSTIGKQAGQHFGGFLQAPTVQQAPASTGGLGSFLGNFTSGFQNPNAVSLSTGGRVVGTPSATASSIPAFLSLG